MFKEFYILFNEDEIKNIPKSCDNIFTFSPSIYRKIREYKFHIEYPNPNHTSLSSEIRLKKVQDFSDAITQSLKSIKCFKYIKEFEELIAPYLHHRASVYFYIKEILPDSNSYYLYLNNTWKVFYTKIDIIIQLQKVLSNKSYFYREIFDIGDKYNSPSLIDNVEFICNRLLGFIQKIIFKFLVSRKEELFVLSDNKNYFLPKIKKKIDACR